MLKSGAEIGCVYRKKVVIFRNHGSEFVDAWLRVPFYFLVIGFLILYISLQSSKTLLLLRVLHALPCPFSFSFISSVLVDSSSLPPLLHHPSTHPTHLPLSLSPFLLPPTYIIPHKISPAIAYEPLFIPFITYHLIELLNRSKQDSAGLYTYIHIYLSVKQTDPASPLTLNAYTKKLHHSVTMKKHKFVQQLR